MSIPVKNIENQAILELLKKNDRRIVFEKTNIIPDAEDLKKELENYINYQDIKTASVLGIDIFQYSLFGEFEQSMLPFVFKTLFQSTIKLCLTNHAFIFQKTSAKEMENNFLSTGDGGFFIFETPLHALLFASNFAIVLRIYNSFHFFPKLRKITGPVSMRYAITHDKIYSFDNNFYGRAIINNARILVKDNLNRCLIDENVFNWFMTTIDGLENLQILTIHDIANIQLFRETYDSEILDKLNDEIFEDEPSRRYGIINSDILKIGKITSKETDLLIYNIHLQVSLNLYNDDNPGQSRRITVSLGNLNTSGI